MVLQVDAESICAFTTFVFSPYIRCRFAKYFLANCGVVSHSVTKASSSVSSETKLDCCSRACRRVPPLQMRAKWPVMPHFAHFFPLQGNVADGAVDVSHHIKNTVMAGAIWLCS